MKTRKVTVFSPTSLCPVGKWYAPRCISGSKWVITHDPEKGTILNAKCIEINLSVDDDAYQMSMEKLRQRVFPL